MTANALQTVSWKNLRVTNTLSQKKNVGKIVFEERRVSPQCSCSHTHSHIRIKGDLLFLAAEPLASCVGSLSMMS